MRGDAEADAGEVHHHVADFGVYAVDCDDVNTAYDMPKGHSYFRSGPKKGEPGKVFEHIWGTLMTGRVYPNDNSFRRTSIIRG